MVRKVIRDQRRILIFICALLLIVSATVLLVADLVEHPLIRPTEDFDIYREQLINLNENYNSDNRIIVMSSRAIRDRNCIASASGFGDMYVLQYATNEQAKSALNYYNSLSYASAMMDSVVNTQEDTADDDTDIVVLNHLSWGAEILGVDSYQNAIEQKYNSQELPDVYVAVLDTGIDTDNEFLEGRIAFEYGISYCTSDLYNNKQSEYKFEDDHMHGTHVSGTIVDLTLPNVKIIPIKVLDSSGSGDTSYVISAIKYVMDLKENKGLNIVAMNMSLAAGSTGNESTLVFDQAYDNDIMSVVAAGNDSYYVEDYFPANCPSALTISALSQNVIYENFPFVAYYSNYGSSVDLCLPGTNVLSCVPDDYSYSDDFIHSTTGGVYAYLSGTSMATPHASALVALYATYMGESFNVQKVEKALKKNAYDLGGIGRDDLFGYGVPTMDTALSDRELLEKPTLSHGNVGEAFHFEEDSISVSITNNNPAYNDLTYKIYYTLDGSFPTVCGSNHTVYESAITLNESTHLNFVIYLFDRDGFVKGHSQLYEIEYFKNETEDKNTDGTGFVISSAGILTSYTSGLQNVVIPDSVNGIKVRELGNNLFFGLNIRSIVCKADISLYNKYSQKLEYPIRYCPNLQTVTLGSSDAYYAVSHCFALKELILLNATEIAPGGAPSFTLGYSYIGSYTAYGCSNLERIVAYKAKSVGNYAFNYVTTLKELVLPEVTQIYDNAFIDCDSLVEVDLPSVRNVRSNAFAYCDNLTTVKSPQLDYIDSYAFGGCTALSYIESGTATEFGSYSFLGCTGLKELDTHSAQKIRDNAFQQCENIDLLDFSSVTYLGENTMLQCTNIRTIYLGKNSYMIYTRKGFWYYLYGNLQYIVIDFTYSGLKSSLFSTFNSWLTVDNEYRIYAKSTIYTATYLDDNGNEIAKGYHVGSDRIIPPTGVSTEEYQINYLSWQSENSGKIFHVGEEVYLTSNDTFTLVDYNAYYSAYAEQAKQHYVELFEKLTGNSASSSEVAQAVCKAIVEACTVNNVGLQTVSATSDKATVLKNANKIVGNAICELVDGQLLETDSTKVQDIILSAKANIMNVCNDETAIVDLTELVENALQDIDKQRLADLEAAKLAAKEQLRRDTSDIYEQLTALRQSDADEVYLKYDSKIDVAEYGEYSEIISECRFELILLQSMWDLEDYVDGITDEQVVEIVTTAKSNMQLLADKGMSEQELQQGLDEIVNKAKTDIEEYLASKGGSEEEPEEPTDPSEPEEPTDPDPDPEQPEDNTDNKDSAEPTNDGVSTIAVVLIVFGSVVAVALVIGVCILVISKKRKQ